MAILSDSALTILFIAVIPLASAWLAFEAAYLWEK